MTQWCQDPLFSLCCEQILENRSEEEKVRNGERETDRLCKCMCVFTLSFPCTSSPSHVFLYSAAACAIFWVDASICEGINKKGYLLSMSTHLQ